MQINNSSQWDPTESINLETKDRVITEIVSDELVLKRKKEKVCPMCSILSLDSLY